MTEPQHMENSPSSADHLRTTDEVADALENLLIGIGMGWDLDGMIEVSKEALAKARAVA